MRKGPGALRARLAVAALAGVAAAAAGVWIGVTATRSGIGPGRALAQDALLAAAQAPLPAPGQTGAATCSDPTGRHEWRVSWRADQIVPGTMVTATGMQSRPVGGTWVDRGAEVWALRWTLPPQDGPDGRIAERRGPLSTLATVPVEAAHSPRFVSPDGACSAFVTPFGNGAPSWPAAAVLGDSLVAQLRSRADDDRWRTGLLQRRLLEQSWRAEVTGQGGRRLVAPPDGGAPLDVADAVLTDEIRGLRGVRAQVVALGTNDAGWVALAPDAAQYELRLAWVLMHLEPLLDEIRDSGQCTVLVTAGDRKERYLGSPEQGYARAVGAINERLRLAAGKPDDGVRLWDWAERSATHHTADRVPWFGPDTIHLNAAGREAYAGDLARAAQLC